MIKIKLSKVGKKKQPSFKIIVATDRDKMGGNFLEEIGYYNPLANPHILKIDQAKYQNWLKKGAQPTEKLASLLKKK
jgi:small subunit ribosomal protein S16